MLYRSAVVGIVGRRFIPGDFIALESDWEYAAVSEDTSGHQLMEFVHSVGPFVLMRIPYYVCLPT